MKRLLISVLLLILPLTLSAKEVGKVTALQGLVEILKDGKPPAIEAKLNMPVNEKDAIRTKSDSRCEITLIDGTVIKIAPKSRVDLSEYVFDQTTVKATIGLPRGKLGAYVAKETTDRIALDPKANRFEIKTPVAVAGVRGTVPIVTHRANITNILVLTGRVYVFNPRIPERVVEVTAGQATIVREGQPPQPPRTVPRSEIEREVRDITVPRVEERGPGADAPGTPSPPTVAVEAAPEARVDVRTPPPVEIDPRDVRVEVERVAEEVIIAPRLILDVVQQTAVLAPTEELQRFTPPVTETQPQITQAPPPPPPQPEPQPPAPPPPPPPPQPEPQPPAPPQPEPQPPTPPTPPAPPPPPPPQPTPPTPPQPEPEPEPTPPPPPPEPPTPPPPPPSPPPTLPQQYSIFVNFVKAVPGTVNLVYSVTSSDGRPLSGVSYRIYNGTAWTDWSQYITPANSTITVPVTSSYTTQTGYRIEFKAVDQNGIESSNTPSHPTNGLLYALFKGFSGYIGNMTSTTTGEVATISGPTINQDDLNKGVFTLNPTQGSEPQFNSTIQGGGGNFTHGFWALRAQGGTGTGNTRTFTSSRFVLLTPQSLYLTPGSGYGLTATLNDAGKITNLTSQPSVREYPLGFSAKIEGAFHDLINNKVDEISDTTYADFLQGVSNNFTYPSTGSAFTKSYSVGSISLNQGIWWGNWTRNLCCSNTEIRGFAAGYLKDSSDFDYMMYGFYSDFQGYNLGLVTGTKSTGTNTFLDQVKILDIEPQLTFKKVSGPFSQPVTNWWNNYIGGSYQGFFTGGSGTLTIGMKDINTTSSGKISSETLSPRHGTHGGIEPWGVFGIELGGTHQAQNPTGFRLEFSGTNWDNRDADSDTPDYWIGTISSGAIAGGKMSGTFSGKFMTPTHYGTMSGRMLGDLKPDNKWVGIVLGEYGTQNLVQLGSNVHLTNIPIFRNNLNIDLKDDSGTQSANLNAYIGTTSNTTVSAPLYSVGLVPQYQKQNITLDPGTSSSPGTGYVWLSSPTDTLEGSNPSYTLIAGGRLVPYQSQSGMVYALESKVVGSNSTSIFEGTLNSLSGGHGVITLEKAFSAQGERSSFVNLSSGVTLNPYNLSSSYSLGPSNIGNLNLVNSPPSSIRLSPGALGIGGFALGGNYTSVTRPWYYTFTTSISGTEISGTFGGLTTGQVWDSDYNGLKNVIDGKTYGYYSFLDSSTAKTGIFVGDTLGTFTSSQWQNITLGKFISRDLLFNPNIQSSLQQLGIPTVEVGSLTLTGSSSCANNCIQSVTLNNVKFLSPSSGQAPVIWVTRAQTGSDITGTYVGTPSIGSSLLLSGTHGSGMGISNLKFELTRWDSPSGKWEAKLEPGQGFFGIMQPYTNSIQDMRGVAAGTIENSNDFTGSAAGVVLASSGAGGGGTAPQITSVTFKSAEPGESGSVKLYHDVQADQSVVVGYKVVEQGGTEPSEPTFPSGQDFSDSKQIEIPVTVTPPTKNITIKLYAKNQANLLSNPYQLPFFGYLNVHYGSLSGQITNLTETVSSSGAFAAVSGQNKGVVKISPIEALTPNNILEAGGDSASGYWILSLSEYSDNKYNSSYFRYLNPYYYYKSTVEGFNATLQNGNITLLTSDPTLEVVSFNAYSTLSSGGQGPTGFYTGNFTKQSELTLQGAIGAESLEQINSKIFSVGKLVGNFNFSDGTNYLMYTYISNPFTGYMTGWLAKKEDSTYNFNSYIYGLIPSETGYGGIYRAELSTDGTSNVLQNLKLYSLEGQIKGKTSIESITTLDTRFIDIHPQSFESNFGASVSNIVTSANLKVDKYGTGMIGLGGSYTGSPGDSWSLSYRANLRENANPTGIFDANMVGEKWGSENNVQNVIRGKTYGYYNDLSSSTPVTGIFVGETVGTFNPGTSGGTWQTVTVGAFVETTKFLSNPGAFASLGVPTAEVGRVTLNGSNSNCNDCILNLTMTDVIFYAPQNYSSTLPPVLWVTNQISGSVNGNPSDKSISLSGGNISNLVFRINHWQNNKWEATINSGPNFSGSIGNNPSFTINEMRGIAAGSFNGNSIQSGSAAGVVRASQQP